MVDLLIYVLSKLGYPVRLQGSLLPDEPYPEHFFTFWNNAADGQSFYSNKEGAIAWAYNVNFYSTDPAKVNSELLRAKALLKAADFIVTGAGHDVASDEPTHTGRGIDVFYLEKQGGNNHGN